MIKIKKIIFITIKSLFALVLLLTLVLFFYAAFFFEPPTIEKKTVEDKTTKIEEPSELQSEQVPESNVQKVEDVSDVPKVEDVIQDGLFVVVGSRAITKSDIVNEIKVILILNNMSLLC